MIDTHCHLNDGVYDSDRKQVVDDAILAGIEYIIVPATKPDDFDKTIAIAEEYERIYCAIGVHPHDASAVNDAVLCRIEELAKHPKVVAIGEIGLDYHYNFSPHDVQKKVLAEQIAIANKLNLPIIVHNRESENDMMDVLHANITSSTEGVFHCFSGDLEFLRKCLDINFRISFTANITFMKNNMDLIIENTPMDRIMLETDSPYMAPKPNRGKRNVPQAVSAVAEKISIIKKNSLNEVIQMTTSNAKKLFKLPLLMLLFLVGSTAHSQTSPSSAPNADSLYYDDDEYFEEDYDPYNRVLGIGLLLGTNTIVERYSTAPNNVSQDGILSYGGLVNYRFAEAFMLQTSFMYGKNTKVDSTVDPTIYTSIDLSVLGIIKPRNAINFYGAVGMAYYINKYGMMDSTGLRYYETHQQFGINASLGIFFNFSLKTAGTLVINGEWKLNFPFGKMHRSVDSRYSKSDERHYNPVDFGIFSSVPRGGIIWYMPFFNKN